MTPKKLKQILADHALWLAGEGGKRANLREVDMRNADLRRADLRGAILRRANLHGANLHEADLHRAILLGAELRNANLYEADLRGADLYGAILQDANLRDANLRRANLRRANLSGANLHGAKGIVDLFVHDPRGYRCVAVAHDDGPRIAAGCQWFTVAAARAHWGLDYKGDRVIGDAYLAGLDWLEKHYPTAD